MSEQPFEHLAYRNRFVKELRQPLDGVDCFQPFVNLNPENNLIVLNLSEAQFLQIYSALLTGADIVYPDESIQVVANFLKGLHCPPPLVSEECTTYQTYANFIGYRPTNPYIQPDEVPDGYLTQPFLVNGENGNNFPGYEHFDVIVPFDSITFDVNFFEEIAGQLPTITVMVQGEGNVNIRFLTNVQGGLAVVTLDNPPNLLDILAGIVTGSENIVDLNQDLVSLPPETAKEIIFPQPVTGPGIHTVYIVFLPILDDSLIPVRFGGGFRGVELCGFLPEGDMGIQNIRFEACNLEVQQPNGDWIIVPGWENWLDCVPGGGGGGVAAMKATSYTIELGANQDTTSTTMVQAAGSAQSHQYTYGNALIFAECQLLNTNAGSNAFMEIRNNGAAPSSAVQRIGGNAGEVLYVSANFASLDKVSPSTISIYFRANANTARIGTGTRILYTILEFESASDLEAMFVQDIQYSGGILQKKINDTWFNVVDIAGLLAPIQTTANNAAAAASAAQSTANNALTIANGAVTVNNSQNTRLNNLENDVNQIQTVDLPQINLTLADHEARIDALEAAVAGGINEWGGYPLGAITDLTLNPAGGRYIIQQGTWDGTGIAPAGVSQIVEFSSLNAGRLGAVQFVRVGIEVLSYNGDSVFYVSTNLSTEETVAQQLASGTGNWSAWVQVRPTGTADMFFKVREHNPGGGPLSAWRVRQVVYLAVNFNPFTMTVFS